MPSSSPLTSNVFDFLRDETLFCFFDCGRAIFPLMVGRCACRLVSTEMGGESTVMEAGSSFVGAFPETGSGSFAARGAFAEAGMFVIFAGAFAARLNALGGGLITVATPLPPSGGIITENSSTCSLDSFLGGSKGALAELGRLSPGRGKYEWRSAFLPLLFFSRFFLRVSVAFHEPEL